MDSRRVAVMLIGLPLLWASVLDAQPMTRVSTTLAAIARYPAFFHDKAITLLGAPEPIVGGLTGIALPAPRTFVLQPRTGQLPQRQVELRGRLFDIGRFLSDDSRLGPLNLPQVVNAVSPERWPARETLLVLTGASWAEPPSAGDVSLRAIALNPAAFQGRTVTVRGKFRGRNLLGDLPAWPRESQWDFVLQAADAAIWILGRRPRGDGFDLNTSTRAHTGRWLEVTGRVEVRDDLPVLLADRITTTKADDELTEPEEPAPAPLPAPDVVFSAPAQNEISVATDVVVRVQFSRPMRAATFDGNVQVRYVSPAGLMPPPFTVTYRPAPMAVELHFEYALAADAEVEVVLSPKILSADGVAFAGTTIKFKTTQ